MGSNITYLLGAGASCKALPLVSDMKERMLSLYNMLDSSNQSSDVWIFKNATYRLFERYKPIVNEMANHYTPDTYAKKLFLKGDNDKLLILKEFLNLYFYYEQDILKDVYLAGKDIIKKYASEGTWKNIHTPLDYRYDVFLATLLNKNSDNKLFLPPEINILSWNYDNQLEIAYQEFSKSTELEIEESQIIKLNGQCNMLLKGEPPKSFKTIVEELIEDQHTESNINFAWERDIDSELSHTAEKIIGTTEKLIIIGYSFPNFNREIDEFLFNCVDSYAEVFVQVPNFEDFESIKDRIVDLNIKNEQIKHKKDKDQFYIPL